jgi:hypothetical protein
MSLLKAAPFSVAPKLESLLQLSYILDFRSDI